MESNLQNKISINIPNYSGPLEVLLDLAKTQKVNLAEISITLLADQFLNFIKDNDNLNLETASEYLLMATWLAYLKSKLLLPEDEDDDFKRKLCFNFFRSSDYPLSHNLVHLSPDYRFDCDTFFKDLREELFLEWTRQGD